ncbi:MAG: type II secretion system protein [Patescibacteria group bacterium]|jgi:prepilin-type N-terminal cleavage/methylation domain-containing protein
MIFISRKKAFTLMELILVVALIVITSAITAPIYFSAKSGDDLDNSADVLASSIRRAQILSMAVEGDSSWGVKIENDNIIIFRGDDYSLRDSNWDESVKINKNIVFSGLDEIVFHKFYGRPVVEGDIYLKINDGRTSTVNINSWGTVNY